MTDDNASKDNASKKPMRPVDRSESKPAQSVYGADFRHIVRVANTDLKGNKQIHMGLHKIKGISFMFSNFICYSAKVDPRKITGDLTAAEVTRLEEVIKNPAKYNCPTWLVNRRKDYETGQDMHLINTDLDLSVDSDIKRMKKTKSYKGLRHPFGLTVRGQRTKSNFRKNKGKVSLGVAKKPVSKPTVSKSVSKKA